METDVAGEEQGLLCSAHHESRRTQCMSGIVELKSRGEKPSPRFVERSPIDFAIVLKTLEYRRDLIDLIVAVKRVFANSHLITLTRHDIH
ncbi:hypothetical protein SDC9_197795 [bioreactor metagenome]|uniref:Uncharacterized protein n=1 Tax=bioreactor metagenome TaxID=1076179 RepID=A0A645II62_9ZZZZ